MWTDLHPAPSPARRAVWVARLSLWLAPRPSRALKRRNNHIDSFFQRRLGRSLSSLVSGLPVLLLTTRGWRSGRARTVALAYAHVDGSLFVVGGAHGADRDPHWVRNLLAEPEVCVEIRRSRFSARASLVTEPERSALWQRVAQQLPTIDLYRARTPREVPIVRLDPTARAPARSGVALTIGP